MGIPFVPASQEELDRRKKQEQKPKAPKGKPKE